MFLKMLNSKQLEMIKSVENGSFAIPESKESFILTLKNFAFIYDFELLEREFLAACRKCYLSVAIKRGDDLGFVYRSTPMQVVKKRVYFSKLNESTSNRMIDATRVIEMSLIKDGFLVRVANQVRVTTAGIKHFNELLNKDLY